MPALSFDAISGEIVTNVNYEFSLFKSLADPAPQTINLHDLISIVNSDQLANETTAIQSATSKDQRNALKRQLPCVTPSGVFSGGHHSEHLIQHSGLICLDFDLESNPSLKDSLMAIKSKIARDQFSLLTMQSVSGTGLAVISRIEGEQHLNAFLSLSEYYRQEYGLISDRACKDVTRLRFVGRDTDMRHNQHARLFKRYSLASEAPPETSAPLPNISTISESRKREILDALSQLSPDNYQAWIEIGQAINSEAPDMIGFQLWANWSELNDKSGKFNRDACLDKWRTFGKRDGIHIETLFKKAYDAGWTGPDAMPEGALPTIQGSIWAITQEEERRPILDNLIDAGDMLEIIAPSKTKKSFFAMQLGMCVASGKDFLKWPMHGQHRVLMINMEVKAAWQHRRFRKMCMALHLSHTDLETIFFCNTRGLQMGNTMEAIARTVREIHPSLVIVDPLYMLHDGDENSAFEMKPLIRDFMALMAESGACLVSVHHDPKGVAGDRNIRDRGAGSSIFSRAVDARLTLTEHADSADQTCIDVMARNFPPQEGFVCSFDGSFSVSDSTAYKPASSSTKTATTLDIPDTANAAMNYFADHDYRTTDFRDDILRHNMGLTRKQAYDVMEHIINENMVAKSRQYSGGYWIGTNEQIIKRNEWIAKQKGA